MAGKRNIIGSLGRSITDPVASRATQQLEQLAQENSNRLSAVESAGGLLSVKTFTSSGQYVPTKGCTRARVRMVGGGGCGGQATGGGSGVGAGAGGGAGCYAELWLSPGVQLTGGAVVVGIGSTGASGNPGSPTSVTLAGVTYTCGGGAAGSPMAATAGSATVAGGAGGAVPTGPGILWTRADAGMPSIVLNGAYNFPGFGGATPFGAGGIGTFSGSVTGNPGQGYGAGGGGASCTTVSRVGGNGSKGFVEIQEYA